MLDSKKQEQSRGLEWLLDEADEQGYLTSDQIMIALPDADGDLERLETLLAKLQDQDVDIYHSEEEAKAELEEEKEAEEYDANAPNLSEVRAYDAVSLYFKEMGHVPLLTREEEVELAQRMEQGLEAAERLEQGEYDPQEKKSLTAQIEQGEEARDHLIEANTRLVVSVAKKYKSCGLPFLDLIQVGNVGLIKAVDKFDHHRGNRFSTHAIWWIRQAILRALNQQGRTIRIPAHVNNRIRKVYRISRKLEQSLGRPPTPEEIAQEVNLAPQDVRWLLQVSQRPLSLDKPVDDEESSHLGDLIQDETTPSPVHTAERRLLQENVEEMLSILSPRELEILRMRFGLEEHHVHTLQEVGEIIGVSRERVRQIERRALRKLRRPRHWRRLRTYLN